jgi:glycosyltransferase involved in cell wall biosynthesis
VFNNEATINDAMTSVLTQTYPNIEYIVVDGNSTDGTLNIIEKVAHRIDHFISEPDNGFYDAINKGIQLATGDIIGIINSDDYLADMDVLSKINEIFENDLSIEAVYADLIFIDGLNKKKVIRYYSSEKFKPWMFRFGFQPAHPTFYVRSELFKKYGLYQTDLKIAGDFEMLLRLMLKHKIRYKYIKDVWVKMRMGGASTSGFQSTKLLNREMVHACNVNGVYTNIFLVYFKYLFKWWGFLFKS